MKLIADLYHDCVNHRWCDYPIATARKENYRVNNGKPFPVYHADGTFDLAYGFGEKQYTFSASELIDVKKAYQAERANLNERTKLLEKLKGLDLETLREIVGAFCE